MSHLFTLAVVGLPNPIDVVELRGREALSTCYRFDLEIDVPSGVDVSALLGATARLFLRVGGHERVLAGEIERARRGSVLAHGRQRARVRLVPRLRRLALRHRSRIFQDTSTGEIVGQVMSEHGVAWRAELLEQRPLREYCVQRDETDLDFVERLLAEEGIVYRFEPPASDARAGVTDGASAAA